MPIGNDKNDTKKQHYFLIREMMDNAFHNIKTLNVQSVMLLEKRGLLKANDPLQTMEDIIELTENYDHPDRIKYSHGPLIFYFINKDKSESSATKGTDLVCSRVAKVRGTGFKFFMKLKDVEKHLIEKQTIKILEENKSALMAEDRLIWADGAKKIVDAVNQDFLINLRGVLQCREAKFNDGLNEYLHLVLRPSRSFCENLNQPVIKPSQERPKIKKLIESYINNSNSLYSACDKYYEDLGHLSLEGELSLLPIVENWASQLKPEQFWNSIWDWADKRLSPLARYHASTVFIRRPELIPKEKVSELWNEIHAIAINPIQKELDIKNSQLWAIRCDCSKHFLKYLECLFPGRDSEKISTLAWWLAERLSLVFGSDPGEIFHYRKNVFAPASLMSNLEWEMINPNFEPSNLRSATLLENSLWSLSLKCILNKSLGSIDPLNMPEEKRLEFDQSLLDGVLFNNFYDQSIVESKNYAFEESLIPTAEKWIKYTKNSKFKEVIEGFKKIHRIVNSQEEFLEKFRNIAQHPLAEQIIFINAFRTFAYGRSLSEDKIWKIISNETWRNKFFLKSDLRVFGIFFNGLRSMKNYQSGEWSILLPHFFAESCESVIDDPERKQLLFSCALVSSINANKSSAIERLLKGKHRHDFLEDIEDYRKKFIQMKEVSSDWAKAKIRPILSVMYISN